MDASSSGGSATSESSGEATTTSAEAECGDGVVEGDEMCDDANEMGSDGCDHCVRESLVFVSSEWFQGKDFGGLFGADQHCRSMAAKAGLRRFETFKAWLSTSTESAASRLNQSPGRYVLVNGLVVAEGWSGLTSGSLQHAIDVTEYSETYQGPVYTGTLVDGTTAAGSTQCLDWTAIGLEEAARGSSAYKDGYWTFINNTHCGSSAPIYCIEQ